MADKKWKKRLGGLLTERQAEILEIRRTGLTQEQTAEKLGISRQDVSVLEKRAIRNINLAADTIRMADNLGLIKRLRIGPGKHILDATRMILDYADQEGIKIKISALGIMTLIQAASPQIENGKVGGAIEAIILPDGKVTVNSV